MADTIEHRVGVLIERRMIALIVADLAVAIAANDNRRVIPAVVCNVMQFQTTIIGFAARSATRIVRAEPFQASLSARLARQFDLVHHTFLSKNQPVNVGEHLASGGGEAVENVGIGFERVRFAPRIDYGATRERGQQLDIVR